MKATEPQDIPRLLEQALNSGDADQVVSLYEPDAGIFTEESPFIRGRDRIRAMTAGFLEQRPKFVLHGVEVAENGDLALITTRWTFTVGDAGGVPSKTRIHPRLVARRQKDGAWLIAIDRPEPGAGAKDDEGPQSESRDVR